MSEHQKLRDHIESLFQDAPPTKKSIELKEEILQNLMDKYNDLLAEGKSEEAAYNIAIASVGDLSALIGELKGMPVYTPEQEAEYKAYRERKARMTAIAIAGYIFSWVPAMLFGRSLGWACMFTIVAASTALLVYMNMSKPLNMQVEHTVAEEFREWRKKSSNKMQVYKSLSLALWMFTLVLYFLISSITNGWGVTWLIFPLAGAINAILKAVFDLKG